MFILPGIHKIVLFATTLCVLVAVSACQTTETLPSRASIFHTKLADRYDAYALGRIAPETSAMFAERASLMRSGGQLNPLHTDAFTIRPSIKPSLEQARAMLLAEASDDIKHHAVDEAANAYFYYDCWVTQEAQWMQQPAPKCQPEFFVAMQKLIHARQQLNGEENAEEMDMATAEASETDAENGDGPTNLTGVDTAPTASTEAAKDFIIYHGFDKSKPLQSSLATLEEVASEAKAHSNKRLSIQGHTDRAGGDTYNLRLSQKRAETVKKELEAKQIEAKRMEALGFGEADNAIETPDGMKEPENRRTEIYFLE